MVHKYDDYKIHSISIIAKNSGYSRFVLQALLAGNSFSFGHAFIFYQNNITSFLTYLTYTDTLTSPSKIKSEKPFSNHVNFKNQQNNLLDILHPTYILIAASQYSIIAGKFDSTQPWKKRWGDNRWGNRIYNPIVKCDVDWQNICCKINVSVTKQIVWMLHGSAKAPRIESSWGIRHHVETWIIVDITRILGNPESTDLTGIQSGQMDMETG